MNRIGRSRQDAPRLRDRVDPAFGVCRGAEGRAVVEECPAIPVAIPAVGLESLPERRHLDSPPRRIRALAASVGRWRKCGKDVVQEPAQPDALPSTLATDSIHAVVPVAAANQRKPVSADGQALLDGRHTMVEQRSRSAGLLRLEVGVGLVRSQCWTVDIGDGLVKDRGIACD